MPVVRHRGQQIHYTVEGAGPLVILQHGLLMDAASWKQSGMVDAISAAFRVACVDSLGHGLSDKPADAGLYHQESRAGDLVAVIDDLGYDKAHLVGYSMGAWMSVGVAKYHPGRLSSLILGGWDPIGGLPPGPRGPLTFDKFMIFAQIAAPALIGWITPESEPGLRACFAALGELQGAPEALAARGFPLLMWCGLDDGLHDSMQAYAESQGLALLSCTGDHVAAVLQPDVATLRGIRGFLDGAVAS